MKAALLQLNSTDNPAENCAQVLEYMRQAVDAGAGFILTPEVTNCVSASRTHQMDVLRLEDQDETLAAVREFAAKSQVWIQIGSLALRTDDPDGRFANRSFLIAPTGEIAARYDKIHMFDVQVSEQETYRESAGYRPGKESVLAQTPFGNIGLTICYDVRFPHLFRDLAHAGADILTIPAAFSQVTGAAHWEPLLRARSTVCTRLGSRNHVASGLDRTRGKERATYGHSMVVDPWGEVVLDAGTEPGVHFVDLDVNNVTKARKRIPSLQHDRDYTSPESPL